MLNLNKCTKTEPKPSLKFKNSSRVCITAHNCRAQHSTEQLR